MSKPFCNCWWRNCRIKIPTAPQDGTQFVSQLAQFSSLEQEIQMRTDLDSINSILTSDSSSTQPPSTGTTQS